MMEPRNQVPNSIKVAVVIACLLLSGGCKQKSQKSKKPSETTRTAKEISAGILSEWTEYENRLSAFRISHPIEWGVIESIRKDRVTFLGSGVSIEVAGGINKRVKSESDRSYSLTLDQAFQEYSEGLPTTKPVRTKVGIAPSLCARWDLPSQSKVWLSVAVCGECVYFLHAECSKEQLELLQDVIERVVTSWKILREVSATDVIQSLLNGETPWDADRLAQTSYEKAEELLRSRDFVEAERHYKNVIGLAPIKPQPRIRLGVLYSFQNRWHEVVSQGRAAKFLDENSADALYVLGMGYHGRGQKELAEREYEAAIALDPKFAAAYYGLAKLYGENKSFENSALYARKCLTLEPQYSEAHLILAVSVINSNPEEAKKHLEDYLSLTSSQEDLAADRRRAEELLSALR